MCVPGIYSGGVVAYPHPHRFSSFHCSLGSNVIYCNYTTVQRYADMRIQYACVPHKNPVEPHREAESSDRFVEGVSRRLETLFPPKSPTGGLDGLTATIGRHLRDRWDVEWCCLTRWQTISVAARHSTVRRVEDEDFVFTPGVSQPSLVNYRIVIDDILDTVERRDHQSQRVAVKRTKQRRRNSCRPVLYCFLEIFRKPTGRKLL